MLEIFKRNYLIIVGIGIIFTWITGAVIISFIEPGSFSTFANSLWWTIVTMTTVGYGDMAPTTPLGRLLAVIIMFFGISLIAVVTGTISSIFTNSSLPTTKGMFFFPFNEFFLIKKLRLTIYIAPVG